MISTVDKKSLTNSGMEIPDYAIESLARCLLPHIQKFYESAEGQRAFEQWVENQGQVKET